MVGDITGSHLGFTIIDNSILSDPAKCNKVPCNVFIEWVFNRKAGIGEPKIKFRLRTYLEPLTQRTEYSINCTDLYNWILSCVNNTDDVSTIQAYGTVTSEYTGRTNFMVPVICLETDRLKPMTFHYVFAPDEPWFYLTFNNLGSNKYNVECVPTDPYSEIDGDYIFMNNGAVALVLESYYVVCQFFEINPVVRPDAITTCDDFELFTSYDDMASFVMEHFTIVGAVLEDDPDKGNRVTRTTGLPYYSKDAVQKNKM